MDALGDQLQHAQVANQQEVVAHGRTREALQAETIIRHTAEQQAVGLKERLAENEAHRLSLEEKHRHAREALEHYRDSVKEQRDQDQRRHEQQVQQLQAELRQLQQSLVVKQEDVTRLNQEGARLVADLSHAQQGLHAEQTRIRQFEQRVESLQGFEQRCKALELRLGDKETQVVEFKSMVDEAANQRTVLDQRVRQLEVDLAAAQARLDTEQTLAIGLRAYADGQQSRAEAAQILDSTSRNAARK